MRHTPPQPTRIYVKVNSTFDATGRVQPTDIIWKDGRVFHIDRVRDYRPASTLGRGCSGDCFTVIIKGEARQLFFERNETTRDSRLGRWWVETSAG